MIEQNDSSPSNSKTKFNLYSLLTPIGFTLLLLIGNSISSATSITDSPFVQILIYLWVAIVLFFWIRWKYPNDKFRTVKLFFESLTFRKLLTAIGSGIGLFILGAIGYTISQLVGLNQPEVTNIISGTKETIPLIAYALSIIILAPILEEIAFRGFIIRQLQPDFPTWAVCIISALLFSIYHLSTFQLLSTFLIGVGLAFVAVRSKNLWLPIIAHCIYNGIGFLLFVFTKFTNLD